MSLPAETLSLFLGLGGLLLVATMAGQLLAWRAGVVAVPAIDNLNARIAACWARRASSCCSPSLRSPPCANSSR
jgi:predicted CDP-diglyceride synthetase/phosphatidate cytidylyltransferase